MNRFALEYVNKNRDQIRDDYPNFSDFKKGFDIKPTLEEMIKYAKEKKLDYNEILFTNRFRNTYDTNYSGRIQYYRHMLI